MQTPPRRRYVSEEGGGLRSGPVPASPGSSGAPVLAPGSFIPASTAGTGHLRPFPFAFPERKAMRGGCISVRVRPSFRPSIVPSIHLPHLHPALTLLSPVRLSVRPSPTAPPDPSRGFGPIPWVRNPLGVPAEAEASEGGNPPKIPSPPLPPKPPNPKPSSHGPAAFRCPRGAAPPTPSPRTPPSSRTGSHRSPTASNRRQKVSVLTSPTPSPPPSLPFPLRFFPQPRTSLPGPEAAAPAPYGPAAIFKPLRYFGAPRSRSAAPFPPEAPTARTALTS